MKTLYPIFLLFITLSFFNGCCTKIHIPKNDKSSLKESFKDDIQSKSQDLSENEIVLDILTHFAILNEGSKDTFFNIAWKPISGAVNYKLFEKKLKNLSFDTTSSQYKTQDSQWNKVVDIPAQPLNGNVYQYKHIIHNVDKEYGEIIPSFRFAYRKYQYKIEAFDASNQNISVNDNIKDAYIIPNNAFAALNDIDRNLIYSLIISGGFLSKDFVGEYRTLEQIKSKTWDKSATGPVSGTHTMTKNANEDSIEYKWDDYNVFDTISISGSLTGKLDVWKRDDEITKQWTSQEAYKYAYQGLMIVLNGTLNIKGMYEATLEFKDYLVIDDIPRMNSVGGGKSLKGKTAGKLIITYNRETKTIVHDQKGNLYADNGAYKGVSRDYGMQSSDMYTINDYRKNLGLKE